MDDSRSPAEVLDDHLRESKRGSVEEDLVRNYSDDLVVLTRDGVFRGHAGLREMADRLREELPEATFDYRAKVVSGEFALLEWAARGRGGIVGDGVDSYVIRNGKIIAQTIHYTVKAAEEDRH